MERQVTRRAVLAAGLTALAGCTGGAGSSGGTTTQTTTDSTTGTTSTTESGTTTGTGDVPVAESQLPLEYTFSELRDAVHTGARKDAIPAIDEPVFVSPDEAEVDDEAIVFGIAEGETVKAYPQQILVWHEVVNDVVDGTPLAVTYCPLTGTALGFERGTTTFGVSGKLVNNNLVMYDRATDSWWSQILGTAFRGQYEGDSLRGHPLAWTTWGKWRDRFPDTEVLSQETGFLRNYGNDPYGSYNPKGGYYTQDSTLFDTLVKDGRHHPKDVFVGTRGPGGVVAIQEAEIADRGVVPAGEYLAVHHPDLDATYTYHNPEGVEFSAGDTGIVGPEETHRPDDLPLDRVMAFDAMWFAWVGFYPSTEVIA
jgi:hypothetical protein